jgi:hypothetical protein
MTRTTTLTDPITTELEAVAALVAHDGVAPHEEAVRRFVATAGVAGYGSVALAILGDRSQPPVLRERALARVAVDVASGRRHPVPTTTAA